MRTCLYPAVVVLLAGWLPLVPAEEGAKPAPPPPPAYKITGPFTHDNLTLFLLHGEDALKGRKVLTLEEALRQKKVVVHETQNVNQLKIENLSESEEVFIQAGDIVKGGQQDRTLGVDLLLAAKSGQVPLPSFCVEHGRWSARGGENVRQFGSSGYALAGNALKLACRKDAAQGKVWENVAREQKKLTDNVKSEVRNPVSASSLQLTLEHKKVAESIDAAVKKLEKCLDGQADAIGCAVVVNGKVRSADVYASAELFRKLWAKQLRASAIEALADRKEGATFTPAKAQDVQAFLAAPEKGKLTERKTAEKMTELQKETEQIILFETREAGKGAQVRRSYLAK